MLVFGTKGRTISGEILGDFQCPTCPNCNSQQFKTFGIMRYFHLYWAPTFITSKKAGIECTQCKQTLIGKEIPKDFAKDIKASVFKSKHTIPMYSGILVIALLVMFASNVISENKEQELAYIQQPAINDIYIVNFSKIFTDSDTTYKYGAMRIKNITNDQAEFQLSSIAYNKASGVRKDIDNNKASSDNYYDNEPMLIDLSKLKGMKESKAIYAIERL